MNEKQTDELDEFMTILENAGILKGWSKFMGREKPDKKDNSQSKYIGNEATWGMIMIGEIVWSILIILCSICLGYTIGEIFMKL